MANDVLKGFSTKRTPQSRPAGGATVKNNAGGHVFQVGDVERLRRFLVLGTDSGHYYASAPDLTRDNAEVVLRMAATKPMVLVDEIVAVSDGGRAPKNKQAIFALAIASSVADEAGRGYALAHLSRVCRTATHLYEFVGYVEQFRGWGPQLKKAVARWYTEKPVEKLAHQGVKYRSRDGWMHRDLLRLSRPRPVSDEQDSLFEYLVAGWQAGNEKSKHFGYVPDANRLPAIVNDYESAKRPENASAAAWRGLVEQGNGLTWEMLPDAAVTDPGVWEALLERGVPITALMRQLPRLTNLGLAQGRLGKQIAGQLTNQELLVRGRVHPLNVLVALRTYTSGVSARGSSRWTPSSVISKALDEAFYLAFKAVEPAGKRTLIALDVSGSMSQPIAGMPLSCAEAGAALALLTAATELDVEIIGFSNGKTGNWITRQRGCVTPLDVAGRRLDDVMQYTQGLNFGATDCALPMLWAQEGGLDFDTIVTITDSETWFGQVHPHQALRSYRQFVGHDVKNVVVGMTATNFTIADPQDASSLDVVGFDTAVPNLISAFSRGDV